MHSHHDHHDLHGPHGHHGHHHNHASLPSGSLKTLIKQELLMHLPYAIFSVAIGMIIVSFMNYFSWGTVAKAAKHVHTACSSHSHNHADTSSGAAYMLFHCFHFLHLLFAASGTMITFFRFSKNLLLGIIVGTFGPAFFCLLSDAILPYLGGRLLGVDMEFHICFLTELHNVLPFLGMGILNGILLSGHHSAVLDMFSVSSHFIHILISSLASLFFLFSHGFTQWDQSMGFIFLFLIFAVVVPCTFSDFIVPVYFARNNDNEKNSSDSKSNSTIKED